MIEAASRRRDQPAPPRAVHEALTAPDRDPARPWLLLRDGERRPEVVEDREPGLVVWSSLWDERPDARVRFELAGDGGGGTDLRWVLLVDEPAPDALEVRAMRRRLDELVNGGLRSTFGQ